MAMISVSGASIRYEVDGAGDWLVTLHEIGGALETWSAITPALTKHFQVLRYDQRGSGHSSKIAGSFSLDTQIADLAALMDELAVARCHIAGVALGAALAVRFAVKYPQRVTSLVLACPAPSVSPDRAKYVADRAALVEREGMAATVDNSLANSYPEIVRRDPAAFAAYRERFLANDPKSYAAINRDFPQFSVEQDLPKVACPALVLAGTHDKLRPPDFVKGLAAAIPGADYREIDSGHVMPVQAPQAMADAMLAFYARIGSI
ncbi:MAG: alpha/beta fold hydrolase [Pseudolabrys sp.]|nr:alpha/beta fold hydrolase [Pseudolabrys sp.]